MSITVKGLVKIYGTNRVVDTISFTVAKGEFVSLLGPSGCGKTTTLRCIAGLEEANGGEIAIGDTVVSAPETDTLVPPHQRDIGMVFQSYAVWPHMTVAQNVGFPLTIRKAPAAEVASRIDWALGIVGLGALRDRHPAQLSGGQQQRVALARAIVGRPRVLLFDEPLSNLDAKLRDSTRSEIRRLQKELDIAALYVTHDQAEALSMSDRVIVMEQGRIMQEGPPKDLYRLPANRFVADFVGTASFLDVKPAGAPGLWELGGGQKIEATSPGSLDGTGPGGSMCQLMLRPEIIGIWPAGSAIEAGLQAVAGKIREAHYLGAFTEYLVETAGGSVKVHANADHEPGTDVALVFRSTDARVIPAA